MKSRQVPFFLYWRVENVQFWINSIGHLGWLSCISNFPRFHKNLNSLELWKYISENSSPKGSFWRNKKKSEFSELSWDSPYLLAVALKSLKNNKAPGMGNITAEVLKTDTRFAKDWLYELFHKTWIAEVIPEDWCWGPFLERPGNLTDPKWDWNLKKRSVCSDL